MDKIIASASIINEDKPQIPCFGIHEGKKGVPYLFQDQNPNGFDFRGKSTNSGFYSNKISGTCPHSFNVYLRSRSVPKRHDKAFRRIIQDPLVKAMSPVPWQYKCDQVICFSQENLMLPCVWLRTLERLSSPLYSHVLSVENLTLPYVFKALKATNVQPLVIYDINEQHVHTIKKIIAEARRRNRTLILIGSVQFDDVPTLKSNLVDIINLEDLVLLPMEHIGVRFLDNFISKNELPWNNK